MAFMYYVIVYLVKCEKKCKIMTLFSRNVFLNNMFFVDVINKTMVQCTCFQLVCLEDEKGNGHLDISH